jgi:hypothetical protein
MRTVNYLVNRYGIITGVNMHAGQEVQVMSAHAKTENFQVWLELYEVALVVLDHPAKLAQHIAEAEKAIGERAITLMREG